MAIIDNNFFQGVSGKIHNVVITSWNGKVVMRGLPSRVRKRKSTERQLHQQEKLRITSSFLRNFGDIISFGFERVAGQSARSQAQQIALREAINEDLELDISKVKLTRGSLVPPAEVELSSSSRGEIKFKWKNTEGAGDISDKCIMVAYVTWDETYYSLDGNSRRHQESVLHSDLLAGKKAFCWIAFRSVDGLYKSDSVYAGEIQVAS